MFNTDITTDKMKITAKAKDYDDEFSQTNFKLFLKQPFDHCPFGRDCSCRWNPKV
jgi:hypothetical protein